MRFFVLKIWELNGYGLSLALDQELALYQYTKLFSAMPHYDIIAPSLHLFHALTGCDTVSSMLGIGRKKAWTCWMRNVENFCQMFAFLNLASSFTSIYQLQEFVMAL